MENTVTEEWLRKARMGDREAYKAIFNAYRPRLSVFVSYQIPLNMRPLLETEDVVQELFAGAFSEIRKFEYRGAGSFFGWLAKRAENLVKGKLRFYGRKKRKAFRFMNTIEDTMKADTEALVDDQTPTRIFRSKERLQALYELLDSLPERYRQAILLTKIEGLSVAEGARRMDISTDVFSVLLYRALKRIREAKTAVVIV